MSAIGREALLAATTVPTETVHVPALGGDVVVSGMTVGERDQFEIEVAQDRERKKKRGSINVRARIVVQTVCDAEGKRMFTKDDTLAISAIRADVIDPLISVAMRLSGMTDADVDELGED